jgi:hypothetical protein
VIDQESARKLAREGFDLWQAGNLVEAATKYAESNRIADPNHWARAAYHGEYSCVLDELGLLDGAEEQARLAIDVELRQSGVLGAVQESRLFAEMLIKHNKAEQALAVLAPYLELNEVEKWALLFTQCKAFDLIGDKENARRTAVQCINCAPTEEKRAELRESLAPHLGDDSFGET